MKNSKGKKSDKYIIITLFFLALLLRIYKLGTFPPGITHDELNYIMTAKSLFLTRNFIPQTAPTILPTDMRSYNVTIAEIPSLLLSPFIGVLNFSLFSSRFIGALFSSFSIVILFYLVLLITENRSLAFISSALMTINPWSFLMGRTIFEMNLFVLFFLSGFLILLKHNNWKIFYCLPLFILGFFSYTGGQVSFYLFMIVSLIYRYFDEGSRKKLPYITFGIIISLVFSGYLYLALRNQASVSRGGELYLPTTDLISQEVNKERLTAVASKYNNIFINKATVYAKGFFERYLDAYSPVMLFISGENRPFFSYKIHGSFYLVDFILLILGACYIFQKYRKVWMLFIGIILTAPVTSGLSLIEHSYAQRAALMYPFLIVFIAAGFIYITNEFPKIRWRKSITLLLLVIYILSSVNLLHIYFKRYPVYASDGWFFQDRLLSRYIELTAEKYPDMKIDIYSSEPKLTFEEYLYFTNKYNKNSAVKINNGLNSGDYSLGNVSFTSVCPGVINVGTIAIFDPLLGCDVNKNGLLRITRFQDVLEKYLIKNDLICQDTLLNNYVYRNAFSNFNVDDQSRETFCRNWITKL